MASQADVDAARTSMQDLDSRAQSQLARLQGGHSMTEEEAVADVKANWWQYTTGKFMFKVEGGFLRIQIGISDAIVYGFKGEYVTPVSTAFILGIEDKAVLGITKTTIHGAKSDDIGGAKVDNLLGIKYERKATKEEKMGASPALRNGIFRNDKMSGLRRKFGDWGAKAAQWLYKVDKVKAEIGSLKNEIASLREKVNEAKIAGATYAAKIKSMKEECASKADLKAANISYDCNGWQLWASGSSMNLFPSSECTMKGGGSTVNCHNSHVRIRGPKHFIGKSF